MGGTISTVIMCGKGPKNNEGNMLLETEPGFTTLLVATKDANKNNPTHNGDMSKFGVLPQVFNTLMPEEDHSMYDVIEVKEKEKENAPTHFCVQLPMSHLIDENGMIEQAYSKVKTATHASDVLESIK